VSDRASSASLAGHLLTICTALQLSFLPLAAAQTDELDPESAFRFTIARVQYDGGGDWYSDPSSLPNLLRFVARETGIEVTATERRVRLTDEDLFAYPYLYLTGHGNISLAPEEIVRLRQHLEAGGFLHADDNYGMDESFRREIARVFPMKSFVEIPASHPLFSCHFEFPQGLPKIHEHDGGRPQALGLFEKDRLILLYTFESDLGDGWEDPHVHGDPDEKRRAALEMGTNIVVWALVQ
jgi:hypothetical protein